MKGTEAVRRLGEWPGERILRREVVMGRACRGADRVLRTSAAALLVGLLAVAVTGCAATHQAARGLARPQARAVARSRVSLVVTRVDLTPFARRWSFSRTITQPKTVETLYSDVLRLPVFPSGVFHCPVGFFVTYRLFFQLGAGRGPFVAQVDPTGCQVVHVSAGPTRWAAIGSGPLFLSRLRQVLGIGECAFTGFGEASHPPACRPVYQ